MRLIQILLSLVPIITSGQTLEKASASGDTSINLYAFVGEKISVVDFDSNKKFRNENPPEIDSVTGDTIMMKMRIFMDAAFIAKYRVVHEVYNHLSVDTVEFEVYDHWGRPHFEKYQTVLLYISKSEDGLRYVHQKYQYDELRKNRMNLWVGRRGESLRALFDKKRKSVFISRGVFPK
jgi:hypothetical protein